MRKNYNFLYFMHICQVLDKVLKFHDIFYNILSSYNVYIIKLLNLYYSN